MNSEPLHRLYEELAQRSQREQEARQRDIFFVLAADAALAAGSPDEAERLRQRLLQVNPHSLLRPYASFAEALQSSDIQDYVAELRRVYPPLQADKLLHGDNGKDGASANYCWIESAPPRPVSSATSPGVVPQRREQTPSPYEHYEAPLPASKAAEKVGAWAAWLLYVLVFLAAVSLAIYVIVRPFLP